MRNRMNLYVLGLRERVGGCMYAFFFVGGNFSKNLSHVFFCYY